MSSLNLLIKEWPLLRYAVEISQTSPFSNPKQLLRRETIDCSEGFLCIRLMTTQHLYIIRDDIEELECIDLSSNQSSVSSIAATYTEDSLMINYKLSHNSIQRKFLIKFAPTPSRTSLQQCEHCLRFLSRLIDDIRPFDSTTTNATMQSKPTLTIKEMIQLLLDPRSMRLSNYYNHQLNDNYSTMSELIEQYLCDETFPDFVANVAAILDTFKNTSN